MTTPEYPQLFMKAEPGLPSLQTLPLGPSSPHWPRGGGFSSKRMNSCPESSRPSAVLPAPFCPVLYFNGNRYSCPFQPPPSQVGLAARPSPRQQGRDPFPCRPERVATSAPSPTMHLQHGTRDEERLSARQRRLVRLPTSLSEAGGQGQEEKCTAAFIEGSSSPPSLPSSRGWRDASSAEKRPS